VATLQHAVRWKAQERYRDFARLVNEQENELKTIRGLFRIRSAEETGRTPVPLEEVESRRGHREAVLDGRHVLRARSRSEAHETLAIAMNRMGAKSNTGEGRRGARALPAAAGRALPALRDQAGRVGRFGRDGEYLVNSDVMQIKIAQGAKPGEGGQLPGHKVDAKIARVRHSTPGVGLISPPPHHDIYSIEDLAQLIFDLKNVNPRADVSVKLVSKWASGRSRRASPRPRRPHHDLRASRAARARRRSPRSSMRLALGRWAWPRRSRRWS
jgi:glutamate synthase (NADPH/NADH) large chain